MRSFKAACVQVNAGNDLMANCETAAKFAVEARAAGADLILMPENVAMMEWGRSNIVLKAMPEDEHLALKFFRDLAREIGAWLHIGSLHVLIDDGMVANRGFVISPDGAIAAKYDRSTCSTWIWGWARSIGNPPPSRPAIRRLPSICPGASLACPSATPSCNSMAGAFPWKA